ncbi:unnamed protein product [Strongylus vulgaris]|uniref:Uncharacterized protein n=1 Tax=Strongylus vulgaris TaxID=40348 RepID=A0A3P7K4S7_STRVU|nr:unnamed protein product [Strongylus vulgaris]
MLDDTMYEIRDLRNSARSKKKYKYPSAPGKEEPGKGQVIEAGRFSTESVDQAEEELVQPNAENFMANIVDIEYVTHDMVRNLTSANDFPLPVAIEVKKILPFYLSFLKSVP